MERDSIYDEPSESYQVADKQATQDTVMRFGPDWMYDTAAREYQAERFIFHCQENARE